VIDARQDLIYRALVALDHEAEAAGADPSKPGPAVRFCLAFLHAISDGKSRQAYVGFWKDLIDVDRSDWAETHKRYRRQTQLRGGLHAIVRSVGLPPTPGLFLAISRGREAGLVRPAHVETFWNEVAHYHMRGVPARKQPVRE
jgi:hypothetical protein